MSSRQQAIETWLANLQVLQNPEMSGQGNSLTTSTTVTGQIDQFEAHELLQQIRGQRTPFGFYASHAIQTAPGYDVISITFEDIVLGVDGTTIRYNLSTRMIDRPIEQHPDYKVIWNHHIVGPFGAKISNAEYLTWAALTKTNRPTGATEDVHWAKVNQAIAQTEEPVLTSDSPFFWCTATKPTKQSYLVPGPVVVATIYTRDELIMENYVALAGELIDPGNVFGLLSTDLGPPVFKPWLATSPTSEKVNDWYVITVEYLYAADGWDTDIY